MIKYDKYDHVFISMIVNLTFATVHQDGHLAQRPVKHQKQINHHIPPKDTCTQVFFLLPVMSVDKCEYVNSSS